MDTQTRHALKQQDAFVTATHTGVDWFQTHRATVIKIALAAIILIVVVVGALVVYNQRAQAADVAFGEAMDTFTTPLPQPGQAPDPAQKTFANAADRAKAANQQFTAVADHYGMLEAGKNALYFAGITAMEMNQNSQAETDLKKVADGRNHNLAALGQVALANLYQQTGRTPQAIDELKKVIAKPSTTVPASAAQLQLADIYQTTNPAEANRIYAQLKNDKTAAGQIAAQKLNGQK